MSWYLFFMSLSAGVALLQPTLLNATGQLVKSEESSLEPTDQLVKPEERGLEAAQEAAATPSSGLLKEQEKKEQQQAQVGPQPAAPSGFGYTLLNGTGNLIKLLNVAFIGGGIFGLFFFNTIPKRYFVPGVNTLPMVCAAICSSYLYIAFFAKIIFYFVKGYAWFKGHPTAFMVGLQLLLLNFFSLLLVLVFGGGFFSLKAAMFVIWLPIIYFPMALFDLALSAFWQRSWLSSCLLG